MFKLVISYKKKDNKDNFKCRFIDGNELDCAFCKYKNTDKCKLKKTGE